MSFSDRKKERSSNNRAPVWVSNGLFNRSRNKHEKAGEGSAVASLMKAGIALSSSFGIVYPVGRTAMPGEGYTVQGKQLRTPARSQALEAGKAAWQHLTGAAPLSESVP